VYEYPSDEQVSPTIVDSGGELRPPSRSEEPQTSLTGNQLEPYHSIYPRLHEHSLPPLYRSFDPTPEVAGSSSNTPEPPASSGSDWIQNANVWQPGSTESNTQRDDQIGSPRRVFRRSISNSLPLSPQVSDILSGKRLWPLEDENEALLLRHFVAKLSLWVIYHHISIT
jgi:hypothetical protein